VGRLGHADARGADDLARGRRRPPGALARSTRLRARSLHAPSSAAGAASDSAPTRNASFAETIRSCCPGKSIEIIFLMAVADKTASVELKTL
jgi:hypothetical protein